MSREILAGEKFVLGVTIKEKIQSSSLMLRRFSMQRESTSMRMQKSMEMEVSLFFGLKKELVFGEVLMPKEALKAAMVEAWRFPHMDFLDRMGSSILEHRMGKRGIFFGIRWM